MRILIANDEDNFRQRTEALLEGLGHETVGLNNGIKALAAIEEDPFDLALLDWDLIRTWGRDLQFELLLNEPSLIVIILTSLHSLESAKETLLHSDWDFLVKPILSEQILQLCNRLNRMRHLSRWCEGLQSDLSSRMIPNDWTSQDPMMTAFLEQAWQAALTTVPLLLRGEIGTGKTLLAKAIHEKSLQPNAPFYRIDCQGLSSQSLEWLLFGQTHAEACKDKSKEWGILTRSDGGILFLDDIEDISLDLQAKLLRLIQDQEYERPGENRIRKTNLRIVVTLGSALEQSMQSGLLQVDFSSLLSLFSLSIPPLRERMADMPRLASSYLHFYSSKWGKQIRDFSAEAMEAMHLYSWPGNLSEMRNLTEQVAMLSGNGPVRLEDLPERIRNLTESTEEKDLRIGSKITLEKLESEHIKKLIRQTATMEEAARILGIDPATLYRKRKKWAQQDAADRIVPQALH